jgi:hypothetical protein
MYPQQLPPGLILEAVGAGRALNHAGNKHHRNKAAGSF